MAQSNALDLQFPISVANGGTGVSTLPTGFLYSSDGTTLTNFTIPAGQLLGSANGTIPAAMTIANGTGINVATSGSTITISSTVSSSSPVVNVVNGSAATLVPNSITIVQSSILCVLTLPATFAVGTVFEIVGDGTGLWTVALLSGQSIKMNSQTTSTGILGALSATSVSNCVRLIATVANTKLRVVSSSVITNISLL